MNCKEWKTFLKRETYSEDSFKNAKANSDCWHSCAVGCRLQQHMEKTGVELYNKSGGMGWILEDMLTVEAKRLGIDFTGQFYVPGCDDFDSEETIRLFNQIQEMPIEEIINMDSELYKQLKS